MSDVVPIIDGQLVLSLPELAAQIRAAHRACEESMADTLRHAIRAGQLLRDAKAQVKHGQWLPWLAENFNGSRTAAWSYMNIAANVQRVEHLGSVREALAELATPRQEEREHTEEESNALWKGELAERMEGRARETTIEREPYEPVRIEAEQAPTIPGQTAIPVPAVKPPTSPVLDPGATPEAVAAENERTHRYAATRIVASAISPLRHHPATREHATETVALLDPSPGDDITPEAARHVSAVLNLIADALEGAIA